MPRFVAVHTMSMAEEQWNELMMSEEKPSFPPGVSWKLAYCDFADGKFFCEWEAPNKDIIEQVFKEMEMPFDVVYPVRLYDVAKNELEP